MKFGKMIKMLYSDWLNVDCWYVICHIIRYLDTYSSVHSTIARMIISTARPFLDYGDKSGFVRLDSFQ